jgi:hypothetical protein
MKDSEHADRDEARASARSDRWKAMPDGAAKLAAYLQQAHERARRERGSGASPRPRPRGSTTSA